MSGRLARLALRPNLPRRTVRLRLTLLYGGMFLVSGAALLAITYVLVVHNTKGFIFSSQNGLAGTVVGSPYGAPRSASGGQSLRVEQFGLTVHQVRVLTPQQAQAQIRQARQMKAQSDRQHNSDLHQLLIQSGIALAVMTVLSLALGWIVAGRVLRPLRTITSTARDISATNLNQRLALAGPNDELKELGDTFDALLSRLEASFRAQRQFVANASHELRTPLARQRTVAQVALADPNATAESLRQAHEQVLASGAQQERLIEALLTLTRGQAGVGERQPLDLADLTNHVLVSRRADAERRGVEVRSQLDAAAANGDPRLVERLIVNLIDNAIRHNTPEGRVEVSTATVGARAELTVANTGPVIGAEEIQQLTQPFKRLGADRIGRRDGLGLGLSIVQAIADAHHATLTMKPQMGGGLRIRASFPAIGDINRWNAHQPLHEELPRCIESRTAEGGPDASRRHRPASSDRWRSGLA
jgi:signal transduction histidine kinase